MVAFHRSTTKRRKAMLEIERRPTRKRLYLQVKPETKQWIEEQMQKSQVSYGAVIDAVIEKVKADGARQ
jgi:hypothetical protein